MWAPRTGRLLVPYLDVLVLCTCGYEHVAMFGYVHVLMDFALTIMKKYLS